MTAVTITQLTPPELEVLIENILRKLIANFHSQSQQESEELFTVAQAAQFLSLSVPTIYGLIHKGDLPVMKRSKRCYFSKADLMDYLRAGKRKSATEISAAADLYLTNNKKELNITAYS
jgi:excisionase family DNA binding protein